MAALVRDETPGKLAQGMGFTVLTSLLFFGWLIWWHNRPSHWATAALPALLVVDLFTVCMHSPNTVPDKPENRVAASAMADTLSVQGEDISWRVDGAVGLQGYGTYFRIPDIYGTGPFSLDSIERLRQIPVDRFWEVLAVRYLTLTNDPPATVPVDLRAYGTNGSGEAYEVFELQAPRPFAHLVYDTRVAQDNPTFARQMMADLRVNLREMAITTEPLPFDLSGTRPAEGSAVTDLSMSRPEHISMSVSTPENALLTVSVLNYPGWRATVNGKRVAIVDTYAGLIGIPIRAGQDQRVELEFVPQTVIIGDSFRRSRCWG